MGRYASQQSEHRQSRGNSPVAAEKQGKGIARMDEVEVRGLDPNTEAPHMVVDRNPGADEIGHGRTLPLVGGVRPYTYDVVFDEGRRRVYADTPGGVLSAFIPGYAELRSTNRSLVAVLDELDARDEEPTAEQIDQSSTVYAAMYNARYEYGTKVRVQLQAAENAAAQAAGTWDTLSDEERQECELAAQGRIPDGVIVQVPWDNDLTGEPMIIDQGVWETDACRLVINDGDYGINDPDGSPAPTSTLPTTDEDGREMVIMTTYPENMIILYLAEDTELLQSLERAELVSVEVRPVDLPDEFYTEAVKIGAQLAAGELEPAQAPTGPVADTGQDPMDDPVESAEDDHHHDHNHDHHH